MSILACPGTSRVIKGRCFPQAGLWQKAPSDSLMLLVINICPCNPEGFSSSLEQDRVPGEACPAQNRWGKEVCPILQPQERDGAVMRFPLALALCRGWRGFQCHKSTSSGWTFQGWGWWSRGSTGMGGGGGSSRKGRNLQLGNPFVPPGAVPGRRWGRGEGTLGS